MAGSDACSGTVLPMPDLTASPCLFASQSPDGMAARTGKAKQAPLRAIVSWSHTRTTHTLAFLASALACHGMQRCAAVRVRPSGEEGGSFQSWRRVVVAFIGPCRGDMEKKCGSQMGGNEINWEVKARAKALRVRIKEG